MLLPAVGILFVVIGLFFFIAGTVGLLRFPDVFSRLHAITKADNVGLGFLVLGMMLTASDGAEVLKLLMVWVAVLVGSATGSYLISRAAIRSGIQPWIRSKKS